MQIETKEKFLKDAKSLPKQVRVAILELYSEISNAKDIFEIKNIKKLSGYKEFYRVRIGEYRVGIALTGSVVVLSRVLHRKDIYKKFP